MTTTTFPNILILLAHLTGSQQRSAIHAAMRGEEGQFFREKLEALRQLWNAMPATYESVAKGRAALAQFHFFTAGADWYIVEKDIDPDGDGQIQAFGIADLGYGPELGYISLPEILAAGAELDIYFAAKTVAEITGRCLA
ncbi:MAG: DUF2958 domain-containing protein [Deltaproteobacteria bacterium]